MAGCKTEVDLAAIQQRMRELLAGRYLPELPAVDMVDYLILREQAKEAEADESDWTP
jgi:hypothetical protein